MSAPRSYPACPFFVGVGRSGTTLLRSIFDAHSEMAVANESRFVVWMADHRARYGKDGAFARDQFLADLLDNRRVPSRVREWGLEPEAIRSRLADERPTQLADAVRSVFALYAERQDKCRYGDKTPRYVRNVDVVAGLLPEARIVHLVRDGRDVALAVGDVDFGAANLTQSAHRWAHRVKRAEAAGSRLGPTRYRLVRYEDLTDDPETVVNGLCRFLALDYEPGMLRYFEHPDAVFSGLGEQAHHDHLRLPVTKGLRDWRRQMSSDDVARFEAVAGYALAELGYEVTTPLGSRGVAHRAATVGRVLQGKAVALTRARRRGRANRQE